MRKLPAVRILLAAALGAAQLLVWAFIAFLVVRIATYGMFWDDSDAEGSWGGPTLAGAWIVHALIAAAATAVLLVLVALLRRARRSLRRSAARPSSRDGAE